MGVILKKTEKAISNKPAGSGLDTILSKEISFRSKLSDKEKEHFYQYISTLAGSGIQLPVALKLYNESGIKGISKKVCGDLLKLVNDGHILSAAMQKTGQFEPYEFYNILIGEETGKINEVLNDLKTFFENKLRQQRKIRSVMAYPVIVLSVSLSAVWFLMSFIVPLFTDIYKKFGGELPWITKFVIAFSDFIGSYYWVILLVLAAILLFRKSLSSNPLYKKGIALILLRIPGINSLILKAQLARFCSSMALMLKSDIPFIRALDMAGKMIDFYPIQSVLPQISASVIQGGYVYEAFAKHPIFERQLITLLRVGEEVNKLDEMFTKLAHNYEEGLDHNVSILNTILEPVIIIFLGFIIGFILIAMYLPMFSMGNQMVQ